MRVAVTLSVGASGVAPDDAEMASLPGPPFPAPSCLGRRSLGPPEPMLRMPSWCAAGAPSVTCVRDPQKDAALASLWPPALSLLMSASEAAGRVLFSACSTSSGYRVGLGSSVYEACVQSDLEVSK